MSRLKDRERVLTLRKRGMSYSQIKKELNISKSTLSIWLRDYPLSKERIRELRDFNEQRIERYRETMRKKKELRLSNFYKQEKAKIFSLSRKELYLAGLFLYWGEGSKTSEARIAISNTDPGIIKFFIFWLKKYWKVPKNKLKIQLHLYIEMNTVKEISFWSKELDIPEKQFIKPYIKISSVKRINHKGGFGHGTCNVVLGDARLSERVFMGLKVIRDHYVKMRV
jgi:transcriptional regulator with XRE-family HTH domain